MKQPCVYILSSGRNGTLYIGVTSNLIKRIWEHKNHVVKGFTQKYNLSKLVYFESFETIDQAIIREKQIKDMNRQDKLEMITKINQNLEDLYSKII